MIHGDHWDSVIDLKDVTKLAGVFKKILQEGSPSSIKKYHVNNEEKVFKYYTFPNTNLRFLSVGMLDNAVGAYRIINSIPFCFHGIDMFLKIDDIYVDNETYEAIIQSSTVDGMTINFYDPLFFMNMGVYEKETYRIFRIAGLAYSLYKTKPEKFSLVEESIHKENEQKLKELNAPSEFPNEVEADKCSALFNLSNFDNSTYNSMDDYYIQSFIKEISEFNLEGQKIYQLHLSIEPIDKPIKLIVYAAEKVIEPGYIPQVGDNIYCYFWLQAYSTH